jgi:glycolate oxidase FAD binding subunit
MPASAVAASDVADRIATQLGAAAVAAADACARWEIGGVVPALVVRPADQRELAASVATVAAAGGVLVALGRGAHRSLGHAPSRYDLALVTERLNVVREYTPADMTVTVEAGVTAADLADALAREGQWLPIEPALPHATTIGGMLAADLAGPLAAAEGRLRDFVIGLTAVTAAGIPTRSGGRVVKNVAGYDLMKLFVGSLGTLVVVTEATFKVRPLPERQHGLELRVTDMNAAFALAAAIGGQLAVTIDGELRGASARTTTVFARLGGVAADVAMRRARILDVAARHGATAEVDADLADAATSARVAAIRDFAASAEGDVVARIATLPSRMCALAADAPTALATAINGKWQADPSRGVLTIALGAGAPGEVPGLLAALGRLADAHAARLVVERWPLALAAAITVWHPLPASLPLMRRMKAALDPSGVLAPGRFVGRI